MGLVLEYHYDDGDVGAYADTDLTDSERRLVEALWATFSAVPKHKPVRIVIRPATPEGD